jgi:hypothetical protein
VLLKSLGGGGLKWPQAALKNTTTDNNTRDLNGCMTEFF